MTVNELIKVLNEVKNKNRIVIMSRDGEGNGFSPLSDTSKNLYKSETTWAGQIGLEHLTPELHKKGYSEEDVIKGEPALVLWPTY